MSAVLLLGGCAATDVDTRGGTAAGAELQTTTVSRGSVTSMVVLPARVAAEVRFLVTAPFEGSFSVEAGQVHFTDGGGRQGVLDLPDGIAVLASLAPDGAGSVPVNYPVAEASVQAFALVAELDQAAVYRMYTTPGSARGQIDAGPGPFDCPLANPVPLDPSSLPETATEGGISLICIIPTHERVFAGMTGVIAVETGSASDVLLLPVDAIAGSYEHGEVTAVAQDGTLERRPVTLGVTDGAQIEVRSGVALGDRVVVPAPNLDSGGS